MVKPRYVLKYEDKRHLQRRGRFGEGQSVQHGSRARTEWSAADDQSIKEYPVLDDLAVSRLSFRLKRPPSEVRARHALLLQEQLRERKEAAVRISERLNALRQKQQHP